MAGKVFWILALGILVTIGLLFKGYDVLIAALGMIFIALIALKISVDKSHGKTKDIKLELGGRLGSLDGMVQDLTKAFKEQSDIKEFTLGALERTKTEIKAEVKDSLDMLAKKSISMENNMNQMKRTFSAAFASLDDRLRAMEPQREAVAGPEAISPDVKMEGGEGYLELNPEGPTAE